MKKILIDFDRESNPEELENLYNEYVATVKDRKLTVMGQNLEIFAKGMRDFVATESKKKGK